ncbi:MAG: T9SS type A sorting domain-containing protein, partial [Saprospiraceae bacterium]
GDLILCPGYGFALTASGASPDSGYHFQWFWNGAIIPDETDSTMTIHEPGVYQVRLIGGPCTSALSAPVNFVEDSAPVGDHIGAKGDTLMLLTGPWMSYQWYNALGPIPGATDSVYVATQSGLYFVLLTSLNGCQYLSGGFAITVSGTSLPASVHKFSLAPNPTSDQAVLTMDLLQAGSTTISMTDSQGRTLFSQSHQEKRVVLPIDLRALPAGTYFLQVQTEKGSFVRQLVRR